MKLVVSGLYKDLGVDIAGSEGIVLFFKDAEVIHVEKFFGKCTSKYVRSIKKSFDYDTMLAFPTEVGGVFEVELQE